MLNTRGRRFVLEMHDSGRAHGLLKLAVFAAAALMLSMIFPTSQFAHAITWAGSYGSSEEENVFRSVVALADGSYIVAGVTNHTGAGANDIWIFHVNSTGGIDWQKTYGGARNEEPRSIQQTKDGGFIVTGPTNSFGSGANDVWVLKLENDGDIEWEKTYGGTKADVSHAIEQTFDGGYIVAGHTKSFGSGGQDHFVFKLNSTGGIEWQKAYGGSGNDVLRFVKQVSDGGYVAAGFTHSFGTRGDIMVIKLDSDGNMEWDRRFGGNKFEEPSTILEVADGYIILEQTASFSGSTDGWIFKVGLAGEIDWQKRIGGKGFDELSSAQPTLDGGFIVAGETRSFGISAEDFWVLKFDSDANIEWEKRYGGSKIEEAESVAIAADGGYIVAGITKTFSSGLRDIWLVKLDSAGNIDGCGSGVNVRSTNASVDNTGSGSIDTSAAEKNTSAKVKDSMATVQNTDADVSIQCSST
jgi:uncharacterized delta-60 repeat protein